MSRQTFLPYAAGLALAVTLTGCAAESAAPEPTTPVPTVSAPSSSVATSAPAAPAASPTSAAPDFPDGLPAAAKKHTKDGAKAFVRHFVDVVNASWRKPNPEAIRSLCQRESESCSGYASLAERLLNGKGRYESDPIDVGLLVTLADSDGISRIHATVKVLGARVVNDSGDTVREDRKETVKNIFSLVWGTKGWSVREVSNA
ncbi:hypothetical protein Intca_1268 [Intrasporangium calvum DSM 43043]|uniref:Lipoprotein n=1 Tax=Intrasporangium calvum (strain ATCC 23552 / DSM 43043 / JCM 3097 / NBRC 12989 / NCIMB 10167 / NRRL B-3866 / 7 KIP) TaxID=710696 RepID=E6SFP1_INTC7|nr:hypothetical protein Intca_1268 [Intrasporangium calvum DSM 43043]